MWYAFALRLMPPLALSLLFCELPSTALACTQTEAREIFDSLDLDHHGKVTNVDFQMNKVNALFLRHHTKKQPGEVHLNFGDTLFSREFFDKADFEHKGYLDTIDLEYAIRFDDIDAAHKGYFDYQDFIAYLNKICR